MNFGDFLVLIALLVIILVIIGRFWSEEDYFI